MLPNTASDIIQLEPGHIFDVKMSLVNTSRLEPPYQSLCRQDFPPGCEHEGEYSTHGCTNACIVNLLTKGCNCTDAIYLEGAREQDYANTTVCTSIETDFKCILNTWTEVGSEVFLKLATQCKPECNRVRYEVRTTG